MRIVFSLGPVVLGMLLVSLAGCEARDCDKTKVVEVESEEEKSEKEDGACIEFVSTKTWRGDTEQFTGTTDYESGKNVKVVSANGKVVIHVTDRDDVLAIFKPFVARAHDLCDGEEVTSGDRCAAIDDDLADQELIFEEEDGHYLIQNQRHDSVASLGADIEVELPRNFNGRLTVAQGNGSTAVEAGDAAAVIIESENGGCDINTGSAPSMDIRCENGSTAVTIGAITAGDDVRQIYKTDEDLGDLSVGFPDTDEPFSVSALSAGGDVEINPDNPSGCDITGSDPRSVTVVCNDATNEDPVFTVRSDEDLVDVALFF